MNTYRISDNIICGLYLMMQACKNEKHGVRLSNQSLQKLFDKQHIYTKRAKAFACAIENIFPYHELRRADNNVYVLYLGFKQGVHPKACHPVTQLPSVSSMSKQLSI